MPLDPLLIEMLACPQDKGPLLWFEDEDLLYNPRLHRAYKAVSYTHLGLAVGEAFLMRGSLN